MIVQFKLENCSMEKTTFHLKKKISSCSSCCGRTCPVLAKAGGTQSRLKLARVETKKATDLGCFVLSGAQIEAQYLRRTTEGVNCTVRLPFLGTNASHALGKN